MIVGMLMTMMMVMVMVIIMFMIRVMPVIIHRQQSSLAVMCVLLFMMFMVAMRMRMRMLVLVMVVVMSVMRFCVMYVFGSKVTVRKGDDKCNLPMLDIVFGEEVFVPLCERHREIDRHDPSACRDSILDEHLCVGAGRVAEAAPFACI